REMRINALRRLAIEAETLPASLLLKDYILQDSTQPEATGGFATVYKGTWRETQVAVKYPHFKSPDDVVARKQIRREMLLLRQLDHPNILSVLGIVEEKHRDGLVSKWMPHGTIMQFLKDHPDYSKLDLLSHVAEGLVYLHKHRPAVVHGDLKGSNIFVDIGADGKIKAVVGDFGVSQMIYTIARTKRTTVSGGGSLPWRAPELVNENGDPTFQSDVYSFGMLVQEVMTGRPPYAERSLKQLVSAITNNEFPTSGTEVSNDLRQLLIKCWSAVPDNRPDIKQVAKEITRILHRVTTHLFGRLSKFDLPTFSSRK
ncbi:kinase-like domain-containing protein, partial [Hysterangium stoloniferum]